MWALGVGASGGVVSYHRYLDYAFAYFFFVYGIVGLVVASGQHILFVRSGVE